MRDAAIVRILTPHEWEIYKSLRLQSLVDSPDAFGRSITEVSDRPDAEWARLLVPDDGSATNLPLVAEVDGEAVGLAWGRIVFSSPEVASVYQMWVNPSLRGRGIGMTLIAKITEWARAKGAIRAELGVTCGDNPARRLYERAGFEPVGPPEPLRPASKLMAQPMYLSLSDQ